MGFTRFPPEIGCCCWGRCFWRHLRLEVFFKRCVPLNLLSVPPQKYMYILIGFVFSFLSQREKQWQKASKFVDYAINMQMAWLTFLICACFNILNEFLCA